MRTIALTALLLTAASLALAGDLPDPQLTPGDVLTTSRDDVCRPGWSKSVRHVSEGTKRAVFAAYGIAGNHRGECGTSPEGCEIDHLTSLELGGSNDPKNLWPESYDRAREWNAHVKDQLENELHRMVCDGEMTLEDAQAIIAKDWIAAYRVVVDRE